MEEVNREPFFKSGFVPPQRSEKTGSEVLVLRVVFGSFDAVPKIEEVAARFFLIDSRFVSF